MNYFLKLSSALLLISSLSAASVKLDTSKSSVLWTGTKVTGKHSGTVNIESGELQFKKGVLQSGSITMDMKSIKVTDITGEYAQKLTTHLNSKDFFAVDIKGNEVATYKTKKITSLGKGKYKVVGNLTIKKKTAPATFTLNQSGGTYSGELKFNRTKFGIRYGSGSFFSNLGDKMIHDEVVLTIKLTPKQ